VAEPVEHQVLTYAYVADVLERRGPFRAEHLALAAAWKADGRLVMFGPLGSPPTGGMFVFRVADAGAIDAYVAADPYVANGIVTSHTVTSWTVID